MSGAGARISGEWYLDKRHFKDHYQRVTVGGSTKLQRARQYVIIQSMQLFGVTSIADEIRMKRNGFNFKTGPNTQIAISMPGRVFVCSSDDLDVIDYVTGEATRVQVWEHYTNWEDVPGSEFRAGGG